MIFVAKATVLAKKRVKNEKSAPEDGEGKGCCELLSCFGLKHRRHFNTSLRDGGCIALCG